MTDEEFKQEMLERLVRMEEKIDQIEEATSNQLRQELSKFVEGFQADLTDFLIDQLAKERTQQAIRLNSVIEQVNEALRAIEERDDDDEWWKRGDEEPPV